MGNIGTLPGERLAGLSADLSAGKLTLDKQASFTQRRNPSAFERNEHGHILLTFIGLDLTGAQEIKRLKGLNYIVDLQAQLSLLSKKADCYNKKHRLVGGKEYKVALMPGKEIEDVAQRITQNLRDRGMKHYGYGKPIAGLCPRIREALTDKQMEELGIWYVATLHDPIKDSSGYVSEVLASGRSVDGSYLHGFCDFPANQWHDGCLFAFPVSAST